MLLDGGGEKKRQRPETETERDPEPDRKYTIIYRDSVSDFMDYIMICSWKY